MHCPLCAHAVYASTVTSVTSSEKVATVTASPRSPIVKLPSGTVAMATAVGRAGAFEEGGCGFAGAGVAGQQPLASCGMPDAQSRHGACAVLPRGISVATATRLVTPTTVHVRNGRAIEGGRCVNGEPILTCPATKLPRGDSSLSPRTGAERQESLGSYVRSEGREQGEQP